MRISMNKKKSHIYSFYFYNKRKELVYVIITLKKYSKIGYFEG